MITKMTKYFIEAKIDGEWCDAFRWADLYTTREEAQGDLEDFLIDGAFKTGMSSDSEDYRVSEVLK
tara:strand:- start:43 stop:240 length:198 start_codon:yes stop_codon:yes gene_type:complete